MLPQLEAKGGRTRRSNVEGHKYVLLREEVWSGMKEGRDYGKKRKEEQGRLLEVNSKFCPRYSVKTSCKIIAPTYLDLFRLSNDH